MSRRYLAALALAACVVLGAGLLARDRLLDTDTPAAAAPPSEASPLQQLTQDGQLRRLSLFLAERVAAVAPNVEYRPETGAAGVRWGGDTVISTLPGRVVAALRAGSAADSNRATSVVLAADSVRRDWVLVVGRRADGQLISAAGLSGGRVRSRCAERDVEEYVLGVPLAGHFAGAGLFDLAGRTLGVVASCADRVAALPAREVARLLLPDTSGGGALGRVRDAYGLRVAPLLDERARRYFGSDSGLLLTEVRRGGPADAAGLRAGDVIVEVDGRPVSARDSLSALDTRGTVAAAAARVVTRRRGGAVATVRLVAGTAPGVDRASAPGDVGIELTAAAPARGVPVTAVRRGSPADVAGLRPGDRLLRVGDATVASPAAARRLLAASGDGPLFIVLERDSVERGVLVPR